MSNIKLSESIKAYNIALGNEEGDIEMFVGGNQDASSSILEPEIHLTQYPQYSFDKKEIVENLREILPPEVTNTWDIYSGTFKDIDSDMFI